MNDSARQMLRESGVSVTASRTAVFSYLQEHDSASVSDIIAGCNRVDRASVYRTIGLFRRLQVVQDVIINGRKMIELTDSYDRHHHHISCVSCGQSLAAEDDEIERALRHLAKRYGIEPISHQVEIRGNCLACRKRLSKSSLASRPL